MGIKESLLGELRLIVEVKSYSWASTSISRSGRDGQSDVSSFPRKVVSNRTGLALKEFPHISISEKPFCKARRFTS
jgi:hypothetical protein